MNNSLTLLLNPTKWVNVETSQPNSRSKSNIKLK